VDIVEGASAWTKRLGLPCENQVRVRVRVRDRVRVRVRVRSSACPARTRPTPE